jgi:polar amino acid transport system substrate-binding protein
MQIGGANAIFFRATVVVFAAFALLAGHGEPLLAQSAPSFVDPDLRMDRPALSGVRAIRFLTTDDYPPLNFALADGSLTGFNVDVARAICKELDIGCTIQARAWDTLIDALMSAKGDAVIASIAASTAVRAEVDFSVPYYMTPARFIVRRDSGPFPITAAGLPGRTVGVVAGSAHQAYLSLFFPGAGLKLFEDPAKLENALKSNEVAVAFADGLTASIWLNAGESSDCCEFRGGPYLESRFFGEGVGIAVRKDDQELRKAFNWALARIMKNGVYSEIYLKYFPIDFY